MKGLIFTYILTYGGACVSLFNPYVGLLIYISFAILKPDALWYWQSMDMPAYSSRIVAIALLVGWIFRTTGNWKLGKAWPIVLALLGTLGWTGLSSLQATYPDVCWGYIEELLKIVLPFLVGITTIDSFQKLRGLAWVMVLSQGYVAFELNLPYFEVGFNRVADYGFGGMDNNSTGVAMNTGIGLAAFLGLATKRWWLKVLAVASAGAMTHIVLLSFSRGGMLGLVATGVVAFLMLRKNSWHYLGFAVLALILLRFTGPQVWDRFASIFVSEVERDASAESRVRLWKDCLDLMYHHPVFGVGPRHFPIYAPQYGWPFGKEAHTLWLQAGAEVGVPGLGFLVLFYGATIWPLLRIVRSKTIICSPEMQLFGCMVISSLVGFAVSAQFVSMVGLETPYYVVLIGATALKLNSAGRIEEEPQQGVIPEMLRHPNPLGMPWGGNLPTAETGLRP